MVDEEAIRRKQKLLAMELQTSFGETCPELTAKDPRGERSTLLANTPARRYSLMQVDIEVQWR